MDTASVPVVATGVLHEEGGDGHPVAALLVALTAWTLGVLALVLALVVQPAWTSDQWYFVVDLADAFIYGLVALLLLRRTGHPVAWIISITAIGGGLAAVGFQWITLWFEHDGLYDGAWLLSASGWGWVPGTLALIVVVPYLVRRTPIDPITTVLIALGTALTLLMWFTRLTDPIPVLDDGRALAPLPLGGEGWADAIDAMNPWILRVLPALGLVATLDVVRRWRRSGREGSGLGWLALGAGLMSVSFVPLALPESWSEHLPVAFTPLTHLASQAFFPAAVVVAVLGQRLWGMELFVSRTVTWGLLTGALVSVYVILVALLGDVLPGERGPQIVATAFVVAGAQPGLGWIRTRVNHLVRGAASEPQRVASRVGRRLGSTSDADVLLVEVLDGLGTSLRLSSVVIEPPPGAGGDPVATWGTPAGEPVRIPLVRGAQAQGVLVATGRANERLDARTISSLEELAPIIGGALALATTSRQLAESRSRIAEARDDERRALRRELHDGLGPALAGVGLGLKASRNLLRVDPAAAAELLGQLSAEVDAQVESVRSLAHGLVPPVLEDLGLEPALREMAERYRVTGLDVRVEVDLAEHEQGPLGVPVAAAAYAIVSEAVRNVHRHARATRCTVRVAADGDERRGLHVTVTDDGVGLPAETTAGVGLRSMQERADGIGARLTVTSGSPSGTLVSLVVPATFGPHRGAQP